MSTLARRKALSPSKGSDKRQRTVEEEGTFNEIQLASESLLKTVLRFQTGARRLLPAERVSPLVQWSCCERRLQDELRFRLAVAGTAPAEASETDEDLERHVLVLQQKLAEMATQVNRDELIVNRVRASQALLNCLFGDEQKVVNEEIKRLVLHRDKKACELLGLHAQQTGVKNEIEELQRRVAELRRENQELYAQVKAAVNSNSGTDASTHRSDVSSEVSGNLEAQRARNVILRNVIQLLVLESGVNWASDPALRAVFLE